MTTTTSADEDITRARNALKIAIRNRDEIHRTRGPIAASAMEHTIVALAKEYNALIISFGTDE